MKKIISLSVLFVILFGCIHAQNKKDFNQFYKTYKEKEGVVSVYVPGIMKSMMKDGEKETDEFIKKTKSMRILTVDDPDEKMIKDLEVYLPKELYPLLMIVKDGKETISVKAKQIGKTVEEILFIIEEPNSLTVLCMKGKYNLNDALEIGNNININ